MASKLWKDYNAKNAYDGYFTADNKLRKHAKIISGILEKYGKKKLQEIEKNCQSTISARGINFRVYAANNRAEEKKWPLDKFISLIANLLDKGNQVVLLGSPNDKPDSDLILEKIQTSDRE